MQTIIEEFPLESILIHKKTKERYRVRRIKKCSPSLVYIELHKINSISNPFRNWIVEDVRAKFMLEDSK